MHNSFYRNPDIPRNDFHNDTVSLQVNCTGKEVTPNATFAASVRHDFYLFYLTDGTVQIDSPVTQTLHAGDVFIFDREVPFAYRAIGQSSTTHYFVHFTGRDAGSVITACKLRVLTAYHLQKSLYSDFEALFQTFLLRDSLFDIDSAAKLVTLLTNIGRYNTSNPELSAIHSETRLNKSLAYIHNHFTMEFSISDLAKIENISESRYRAVFTDLFKHSPSQYVTNLRMNLACEYLCTRDMSIEQIANMVGYADYHYFARLFRKRLGMTPSAYRKQFRTQN